MAADGSAADGEASDGGTLAGLQRMLLTGRPGELLAAAELPMKIPRADNALHRWRDSSLIHKDGASRRVAEVTRRSRIGFEDCTIEAQASPQCLSSDAKLRPRLSTLAAILGKLSPGRKPARSGHVSAPIRRRKLSRTSIPQPPREYAKSGIAALTQACLNLHFFLSPTFFPLFLKMRKMALTACSRNVQKPKFSSKCEGETASKR